MTKTSHQSAFTPLRIALMVFITVAIVGAVISYIFNTQSWSYLLGIFSTVFILMSVFLIFLELVWLHSMHKNITNKTTKKTYKKALNIYLGLLATGITISFFVLQLLILR